MGVSNNPTTEWVLAIIQQLNGC